jgi:hypothetical protein
MAVRISDLDALGGIRDTDLFEVESNDYKSYKVTGQTLTNYFVGANNAGYKGTWPQDKSLYDARNTDDGIWWYGGTPPLSGMGTSAMVEIFTHTKPTAEIGNEGYTLMIRYTTALGQAFVTSLAIDRYGTRSNDPIWYPMTNQNGCKIFSGVATDAHVSFREALGVDTTPFTMTPTIFLTPISNSGLEVCMIQLSSYDTSGFYVNRFVSKTQENYVNTVTHTTKEGSGETQTTTEESTTHSTVGKWEVGSFPYVWVAIQNG